MKEVSKIKLPDKPGIYLFKKGKEILYIGKATSLRDRVRSYMSKRLFDMRGPLVEKMVEEANKIDWEETDSVLEALILEVELIKKHQPYYNTKEKDDKSFLSVVITKESLPRVFTIRTRDLKEHSNILKNVRISKMYGPFTNGGQLKEALKIIRPIFPFLDGKSKHNYEFYKQVNLVPDISTSEGIKIYKNNIKHLKLFFEGRKKKVLKDLEKEMKQYAKGMKFERANEAKKQIFALQHINDVALIKLAPSAYSLAPNFRIEAYDIAHMGGKNMVGVMTVLENGVANKNEYRKFKIRTQSGANDTGALGEVLDRRITHPEWNFPNLIVVDGSTAQINAASGVLKKSGIDIPVVSVVKDDRHKPVGIKGDKEYTKKYEREILLANSEAHRFAITYHKQMRNKNFLK